MDHGQFISIVITFTAGVSIGLLTMGGYLESFLAIIFLVVLVFIYLKVKDIKTT